MIPLPFFSKTGKMIPLSQKKERLRDRKKRLHPA
jgi:hypothetical protein